MVINDGKWWLIIWLVVYQNPLKKMSSSVGMIIPNWMEKYMSCSKASTSVKTDRFISFHQFDLIEIHQAIVFHPQWLRHSIPSSPHECSHCWMWSMSTKNDEKKTVPIQRPAFLAGWWFQPLWKIWKSMGRIIPYIMEKYKMFQTTNQNIYIYIYIHI